jgi:hypothetical protein
VNFLIIESLQKFHHYFGEDFRVECPTGSGVYITINDVANELATRLTRIFLADEHGNRPVFAHHPKLQQDPHFRDHLLFYEYFHGDSGRGVGACHQTGWTGLVAKLLLPRYAHDTTQTSSSEGDLDGRPRALHTPARARDAESAAAEAPAGSEGAGDGREFGDRPRHRAGSR